MRVAVTGARGMLGSGICRIFEMEHEVTGFDLEDFDITDTQKTHRILRQLNPEVVIHCAAFTDVDKAEVSPDEAYRVNALGTWNVASCAAEIQSKIVYMSTDFVFDGEKAAPYTEWDTPNPLNYYGNTKLAGEKVIQWIGGRYYIVRTAWLFGDGDKSFPARILKAAKKNPELRVVADQIGTPTYIIDLAETIQELIESPLCGIYQVTNSGQCSWYEYAKKVIELAGMTNVQVTPITSSEWPSPTRRPSFSVLRHYVLELQGKDRMRTWDAALTEFMQK
jgi:dTDP-4-dehydrorhamnose reductase